MNAAEQVSGAALLTVEQVAARLAVQPAAVRAAIRARRLPAVNVAAGGRTIWRVDESDLAAYIAARRTA